MHLIGRYWREYDFFESSALDEELKSRGFDETVELPEYLYRADGMKLWEAMGKFALNFLHEIYPTDADVAADKRLQEWAEETTDPKRAAIPGFPERFEDKETLAKTMQTLMWMASGYHAAVNFPQYDVRSAAMVAIRALRRTAISLTVVLLSSTLTSPTSLLA